MKYKIVLLCLIVLVLTAPAGAQYSIPLYVPGNTGVRVVGAENSAIGAIGQNLAGVSENNNNKIYFGILAPLSLSTEIEKISINSRLLQNYPNPFRIYTTIPVELSGPQNVSLLVTDILGQPVEVLFDGELTQGLHLIRFNADEITPGIYLYQLRTGRNLIVKTMSVTK